MNVMKKRFLKSLISLSFLSAFTLSAAVDYSKEIPFKMPKSLPSAEVLGKKLHNLNPGFLLGASTSEHQCSPKCTPDICSWARFAAEKKLPEMTSPQFSINLWDNYQEYFKQAKEFGLNSLRFSVEWALVQPNGPDSFDEAALDHYADMFVSALKNRITPIVCFHHYTDPCWFIDNGGFEKKSNLDYFAEFCARVYQACVNKLSNDAQALAALQEMHVPLWATFNSPTGYAFRGYKSLEGPPANPNKNGLKLTMRVLANMMEAHVRVYKAMNYTYSTLIENKSFRSDVIERPQIGFLHNIHQLHPANKTLTQKGMYPLSALCCKMGNSLQTDPFYEFFTKGTFTVKVPGAVWFSHKNDDAKYALDWIGINYYSNGYMAGPTKLTVTDKSKTDNDNYRIYPQGLWRAIAEVSERLAEPLGIPMYVTENGIATQDNALRNSFYQKYMYALTKAVEDGFNVRGYLTWTLADNYEWPKEDSKKRSYGLLEVDAHDPSHLIVKDGARWYQEFVHNAVA